MHAALEEACKRGDLAEVKVQACCRTGNKCRALAKACSFGHLHVAQWLWSAKHSRTVFNTMFIKACSNGHLEVAQWLRTLDTEACEAPHSGMAFSRACGNGHLMVAQWLWEQFGRFEIGRLQLLEAFSKACALGGDMSVPLWLWDAVKGMPWTSLSVGSALRALCVKGDLAGVHWLTERGVASNLHDLHVAFGAGACQMGHLHVAQWLQDWAKLDVHALEDAAFRHACGAGRLEVAQWLWKRPGQIILSSIRLAFKCACRNGRLQVAQWLWDVTPSTLDREVLSQAFIDSFMDNHMAVAKWLWELGLNPSVGPIPLSIGGELAFRCACCRGRHDDAKWVWDQVRAHEGRTVDIHVDNEFGFRSAFKNGDMRMAVWLWEESCRSESPINVHAEDEAAFKSACRANCLDMAKWLWEIADGHIDVHAEHDVAFHAACRNGNVAIVEWLWSIKRRRFNLVNALELAAAGGHVPVAQFLWTSGGPVPGTVLRAPCQCAATLGHLPMVKWLVHRGNTALPTMGGSEVMRWVHQQGGGLDAATLLDLQQWTASRLVWIHAVVHN